LASQRRFEGPVLEDLLDQVRGDAGPGAQIVAANRVRKGGLGGFFTREYFEVIVDVPDVDLSEDRPGPAPFDASGSFETADDDETAPPATRRGLRSRGGRAARGAAPEPPPAPPAANTTGTRRVPASILDLAEAVNNSERFSSRADQGDSSDVIDLVEPPVLSTESTRFASILERISHEVDAMNSPAADVDDDEFDAGTEYDDEHDDIRVETRTVALPPAEVRPEALRPEPPRHEAPRPEAPRPETARPETARSARPRLSPGDGIAEEVRERLGTVADNARRTATAARITSDPDSFDTPAPAPAFTPTAFGALPDAPRPATFRRVPRTEAVIERPETALARLGLPARLVPRGATPSQLRGALIESLSDLPAVPAVPDATGVVIAVVGVGASAVLLARELCAEYGYDEDRVVLATQEPLGAGVPAWLQICDRGTAEERRRSWRRRTMPTFVAVNLGAGRGGLAWAREILDHLEPTIAWSIVSAGWKTEDVRDWIERLGGVDALALTQLDDTVSPAAALELGVPIGRLNGRVATPIAWAELLTGRMP
jgi:hypothetical protein